MAPFYSQIYPSAADCDFPKVSTEDFENFAKHCQKRYNLKNSGHEENNLRNSIKIAHRRFSIAKHHLL